MKIKRLWVITNYSLFWIKGDHWKQQGGVGNTNLMWRVKLYFKGLLEAALKRGQRTCPHRNNLNKSQAPWTRKLLASPLNFSISSLRSPGFMHLISRYEIKTFISKIPVQLLGETNIRYAMKAQSCYCSARVSCWAQSRLLTADPPQGCTNLRFGSSQHLPYLISLKPHTRQLWHLQLQAGVFCENCKTLMTNPHSITAG